MLLIRTPPVVAYVTMVINPSLELGLDDEMRVRELRGVNEEAEDLIKGLKYRGRDLETVMNELAHRLVDGRYLTMDDKEIVIASVPVKAIKSQWEKQMVKKITKILNEAANEDNTGLATELDVSTVSLPIEVRNQAEANGISSGKMAFWLISKKEGHEVPLDTIKKESLKDIAASWGGVNKTMSKYEQKQETKGDIEDKNNNNDKGNKNDKDDKENKDDKVDEKDNKDGKGSKDEKDNKDGKGSKDDNDDENNDKSGESNKYDKGNKDDKGKKNDNNEDDDGGDDDDDDSNEHDKDHRDKVEDRQDKEKDRNNR
jgi:hypothetical protein